MTGLARRVRATLPTERIDGLWPAALGSLLTIQLVVVTARVGPELGLGGLFAAATFLGLVVAWLVAPHLCVAWAIPVFAFLPTIRVLGSPWIGPLKDVVVLAAASALVVRVIQRRAAASAGADPRLLVLVGLLLALYVVNIGGSFASGSYGPGWYHGVRLVSEPLILLIVGLTLDEPRRTLDLAVRVLVATGAVVALYGIAQQALGVDGLLRLGYTYGDEVRTIAGHIRSFGTLDEPFAYAAFLCLALAGAVFGMRSGPLAWVAGSLITIGIACSLVRSAAMIAVALVALWLIRAGRTTLGVIVLAASAAAALTILLASQGASQSHDVSTGGGTYITLNGRTTVWATLFRNPGQLPFGLGVGTVGTAAERAQYGTVLRGVPGRDDGAFAVDSGYFATVADIGLIGLGVLLALLWRIGSLARSAIRVGEAAGWLALAWLATLLLDAVTRASFTGFPSAFLGMLLIGTALAAAAERPPEHMDVEAGGSSFAS